MKLTKWISFAFISAILASCYPDKDRSIEDFDIIGTNYNSDSDFSTLQTYYLGDSIIVVYDEEGDKPDYPENEAKVILDGIRKNLDSRGWTEITDTLTQSLDVHIQPYIFTIKVEGATYYPGYGYYNPWYPGYYPGYGGGVSYYSYTTGTILVDMWDIKNANVAEQTFDIIWTAAINGLVSSSSTSNINRIEYSINKAFEQSPYLNK